MIRLYAAGVAFIAVAGLIGAVWFMREQRDTARAEADHLRSELSTASARLKQSTQAVAVHRAYIDRMTEQAAQADADEAEVLTKEGANAPIPDYLRDILDRLR